MKDYDEIKLVHRMKNLKAYYHLEKDSNISNLKVFSSSFNNNVFSV